MRPPPAGASCCASPALVRDHRWVARWGPVAERVVSCTACEARFVEETTAIPGEGDRHAIRVERADDTALRRRFSPAPRELGAMRCPRCASPRADEVEHIFEITRMRCDDCGLEALCDPWDAPTWRGFD